MINYLDQIVIHHEKSRKENSSQLVKFVQILPKKFHVGPGRTQKKGNLRHENQRPRASKKHYLDEFEDPWCKDIPENCQKLAAKKEPRSSKSSNGQKAETALQFSGQTGQITRHTGHSLRRGTEILCSKIQKDSRAISEKSVIESCCFQSVS